ncbi:trehalose 6-phosphate phosphatase [Kitasatospora sp. GAS204A]|uniref:trehalose-phosphatase n=1 Tax=unclassified Kitasatospora TaxID=2633591 RepID=UPI002474E490|nr:trehalose-phosphatase [Kitasatospora sp. GAS204B]MDH6118204.1 trehalose 6-phosphate phosphatase [Kitasatospora sp. GAS204B]
MGIVLEPTTPAGRAGLAAVLADPAGAVVALDFDGTLAPIVADPERAYAHPDAAAALARLAPLVNTVAVVTGRPVLSAVRLGGFDRLPGLDRLVVLGHYGAERWEAGKLTAPEIHPGVAAVRAELPSLLGVLPAPEGTSIEDKERSLAVHTRRTADPQAALELLRAPLAELAAAHGLAVEPGRFVLELRAPGVDKGAALTGLLRERGARSVLYAGDDLGDLAAYAAVERLRAQALPGVLVASGPVTGEPPVREIAERADLVVPGPAGVVELLDRIGQSLSSAS